MPMQPRTVLVSFDKGLNTYDNPHRLGLGQTLLSNGVALDGMMRIYPGAYPVSYAGAGAALTGSTAFYRLAVYEGQQPYNRDIVLAHSVVGTTGVTNTTQTGNPFFYAAESSLTPQAQPVTPFRQATQQIMPIPYYGFGVGSPACGNVAIATSGLEIFSVVTDAGAPRLGFFRADSVTGRRESMWFVASTSSATQNPQTSLPLSVVKAGVAAYAGGTTHLLAFLDSGSNLQLCSISGNLGAASIASIATIASVADFDICYNPSGDAYVVAINSSTQAVSVYTSANSFGSATATGLTPVTVTPSQVCVSIGFYSGTNTLAVALMGNNASMQLASSDATTLSFTAGSVGTLVTTSPTTAASRSLSIVPTSATTGYIGCDLIPSSPTSITTASGNNVTWPYACIGYYSTLSVFSSPRYQALYGGATLIGKGCLTPWGGTSQVMFPFRSGHYAQDASPSPIAYPECFLLGAANSAFAAQPQLTVLAKWADSDAYYINGNNGAFNTAGMLGGRSNYIMSQPCIGTTPSGQSTYKWPWLQLALADGFSTSASSFGIATNPRVALAEVVFTTQSASEMAQPVQLGSTLAVPAGITAYYDGDTVTEAGFFQRAPMPFGVVTSVGNVPQATYYYKTVIEYTDYAGRVQRSAPSLPSPVVASNATNIVTLYCSLATCGGSVRGREYNSMRILWYRTVGNATLINGDTPNYYLVGTSYFLYSSATFPRSSFTDNSTDATNEANGAIYTSGQSTGAAIGTYAPPPFDSMCVWNSMFWGVANRNGPELWFTWQLDNSQFKPEVPSWSTANRIALPADIGQPLGICGLDANLIVFGTKSDYVITGSGPDRNDTLADLPQSFTSPIALPSPGGLRLRNALARTPQGIIFQGTQGFTLLDRSLAYNNVGAQIINLTNGSQTYGAGILFSEQQAIIFPPVGAAQGLIYFYSTGTWAQLVSGDAQYQNWASVLGLVRRREADNSTQLYALRNSTTAPLMTISPCGQYMQVQSSWFEMEQSLATGSVLENVAGMGQIWDVQVQGDCQAYASGTLWNGPYAYIVTLQTEYDYVNNTVQPPDVQTIAVADSSMTAGTPDFQWRFGLSVGSTRRVRFTLTFDATHTSDGVTPQNMGTLLTPLLSLSGIVINYAVDSGSSRVGNAYSSATGS